MATIIEREVMSVYSGRDGRCCCGCAGKHSYASQFQIAAGKHRGYKVDDDEMNDRMVTRIAKLIENNLDKAKWGDNNVSLVVENRLYVAYWA